MRANSIGACFVCVCVCAPKDNAQGQNLPFEILEVEKKLDESRRNFEGSEGQFWSDHRHFKLNVPTFFEVKIFYCSLFGSSLFGGVQLVIRSI